MNRQMSSKQIEAVLALPGPKRYNHFIKQVVDWEEAWGLYNEGWATASSSDGVLFFPLWPAREYAALCAEGEWEEYEPTPITLEDLLDELLPMLEQDGVSPCIFYTPNDRGVIPEFEKLIDDIQIELEKYQ